MAQKILCVAEKPAIAKAVANHLAGGRVTTHNIQGNKYVKNYEFDFTFPPPWGNCSVVMTSVLGHLTSLEFDEKYRKWWSCNPGTLFDAAIVEKVDKDKKGIADNIEKQAKYARALFVWTDCDREGEHIGAEVRSQALKGNRRIQVKRAKFSNTEKAHVLHAARNPVEMDDRLVAAVAARIELDLRIGAAFTRLQTLQLQTLKGPLEDRTISYGSCQFPTLGFVVDRYFRVKNFKPETFWSIQVKHRRDDIDVTFHWERNRLFDRAAVVILFERCIMAKTAKIVKIDQKPTSKWRPLPLTTVDLQMVGSRYLRMDSQTIMKIAEGLYTKGFISYPRTETDQFDKGMDLRKLVEKQTVDNRWGGFAQGLMDGGFQQPRAGKNNDQAHPPIHPVIWCSPNVLNEQEKKVYEFVVRRFLACCADDARGEQTTVKLKYGDEHFSASGLIVRERNYLDVYVYDKWESSRQLPPFVVGEAFEPTEAKIHEGKTTAPGYLTEPELIGLMDANGIGTDATMAEHIAKIKEREYIVAQARGTGRTAVQELIPTRLGVALVEGYDNLALETSLSKPFLRKEMEVKMKQICEGTKGRREVVQESLEMYQEVFVRTSRRIDVLKTAVRKYVLEENVG